MRLILALFFCLVSLPAVAQQQCLANRDLVVSALKAEFNEEPVGGGITHTGEWVSTLTVAEDGNWSIIMTRGDGMTCIIAGGHAWEFRKLPPKGNPS